VLSYLSARDIARLAPATQAAIMTQTRRGEKVFSFLRGFERGGALSAGGLCQGRRIFQLFSLFRRGKPAPPPYFSPLIFLQPFMA
jgi:hypothetical protein